MTSDQQFATLGAGMRQRSQTWFPPRAADTSGPINVPGSIGSPIGTLL